MQIDATTTRSCSPTPTVTPCADPKNKTTADTTSRPLDPTIHIDPALGIVITQYLNTDGGLTAQYPAQQVIANYQIYGMPETA